MTISDIMHPILECIIMKPCPLTNTSVVFIFDIYQGKSTQHFYGFFYFSNYTIFVQQRKEQYWTGEHYVGYTMLWKCGPLAILIVFGQL